MCYKISINKHTVCLVTAYRRCCSTLSSFGIGLAVPTWMFTCQHAWCVWDPEVAHLSLTAENLRRHVLGNPKHPNHGICLDDFRLKLLQAMIGSFDDRLHLGCDDSSKVHKIHAGFLSRCVSKCTTTLGETLATGPVTKLAFFRNNPWVFKWIVSVVQDMLILDCVFICMFILLAWPQWYVLMPRTWLWLDVMFVVTSWVWAMGFKILLAWGNACLLPSLQRKMWGESKLPPGQGQPSWELPQRFLWVVGYAVSYSFCGMATGASTNVPTNVFCQRVPLTYLVNVSINATTGLLRNLAEFRGARFKTIFGAHAACGVANIACGWETRLGKEPHG